MVRCGMQQGGQGASVAQARRRRAATHERALPRPPPASLLAPRPSRAAQLSSNAPRSPCRSSRAPPWASASAQRPGTAAQRPGRSRTASGGAASEAGAGWAGGRGENSAGLCLETSRVCWCRPPLPRPAAKRSLPGGGRGLRWRCRPPTWMGCPSSWLSRLPTWIAPLVPPPLRTAAAGRGGTAGRRACGGPSGSTQARNAAGTSSGSIH